MRPAIRLAVAALVLVGILLPSACAQNRQNPPLREANGDGQQSKRVRDHTAHQERTVKQSERQILTGVVTDEGQGRILVEEDPDANCRGNKGPLKRGCEKMYFDVTGKTRVFRQGGSARKAIASTADLNQGLRVRADYTGNLAMESYPGQTDARTVTILGSF